MDNENRGYPTITIAILCHSSKAKLKKQLDWIDGLYKALPSELQQRLYCFVSENASKDGLETILAEFSEDRKWFSYYIQPEYVNYDLNVLTCYEKSQTDYVWLLAIDDYICSEKNIVEILNLLKQHNPSGVTFRITPERKICPIDSKNIAILHEPLSVLQAMEGGGGGKVSCNIIKKNAELKRNNKDVASFIGIGYMHLSLQAICFELSVAKKFMRIEQQIVWSLQKWGDKNNHHPETALNSRDSIATNYFKKNCPDYFEILSDKRVLKLKFIVYQSLKSILHCWDEEMLKYFIYNTMRACIKPPFSLKVIFYFLAALFALCFHPYYLKFIFSKPLESANTEYPL